MNEPRIVVLPGWSVGARALAPLLRELGPGASAIDLPGQGARRDEPMPATLDALARGIERDLDDDVVLVGWSLGAMAALAIAAAARRRPLALALVAPTPKFTNSGDWPHGADAALLDRYVEGVGGDAVRLLAEFDALMLVGDLRRGAGARQLREARATRPSAASLAAGLGILRAADLRATAGAVACHTLVVTGGLDRVTPPAAARWLAGALPRATLVELAGAGHALPITHAAELGAAIGGFALQAGTAGVGA
jgi:pimeloyl-[acyl-carrier protein] methyl ester esterase